MTVCMDIGWSRHRALFACVWNLDFTLKLLNQYLGKINSLQCVFRVEKTKISKT